MSQSLTINDRDYIPAGEVGKHFGYTRDYILTLSREGKIDGQKIGHRWYVNLESAEKFFESAKAEREARRQVVSEVRKAELRTHVESRTLTPQQSTAFLETVAILAIGLVIGTTGYLGSNVHQQTASSASVSESGYSFMKQLAISVYEFISPQQTFVVTEVAQTSQRGGTTSHSVSEVPAPLGGVIATTTYTSLVVGRDEMFTTTTIESIRDSFSDPVSVSVDPHNPDTGVIIPHFKDGDGETYRFLMVPITHPDNS